MTRATLGSVMGAAVGGYTWCGKTMVERVRPRARPCLFSNTVAPPVVAGALKAIELITESSALRDQLAKNTALFRDGLAQQGFELLPGEHPIVPVMLHDAKVAGQFANAMLEQGVYVVAFSYPVVPKGKARIRTQMSAALTQDDIEFAIEAFSRVKAKMGI